MKILFIIFILIFIGFKCHGLSIQMSFFENQCNKTITSEKNLKWNEIEQDLDHSKNNSVLIWKMRYISNDEFYKKDGPIFVVVSGSKGTIPGFLQEGLIKDMAMENNAMLYMTEERFYGESRPTRNASTNYLKLLSVEQTIEDLAVFVNNVKKEMNTEDVIIFGCFDAGSLATRLKIKYPNLVKGVVASSAPLTAVGDFKEYFEVASKSIDDRDKNCSALLKSAMEELDELVTTANGIKSLKGKFKLCKEIKENDINSLHALFEYVTLSFAVIVQYAAKDTIQVECQILKNKRGNTPLDKLASFLNRERIRRGDRSCILVDFKQIVDYFQTVDWDLLVGNPGRQWLYQRCTEYGYFVTTSSENQIFGRNLPLVYYTTICAEVFGMEFTEEKINEGARKLNNMFDQGKDKLENVLFVNGDIDPWHSLGVLKPINEKTMTILIPGGSHCADWTSINDIDSKELTEAKKNIKNIVKTWLQK